MPSRRSGALVLFPLVVVLSFVLWAGFANAATSGEDGPTVWALFFLAFIVSTVLVLHEAFRLAFPRSGN